MSVHGFVDSQHACAAAMAAADAPPFRASDAPLRKVWCKFHHEATILPRVRWSNTAELQLDLPLNPAGRPRPRALAAAEALAAGRPHRIHDPPPRQTAAPVLPLVLLHGLVAPDETSVEIAVVVEPVAQAGAPPPRAPLPSLDLAALDGAELLRRLRTDKVARLRMDPRCSRRCAGALRRCPPSLPSLPLPRSGWPRRCGPTRPTAGTGPGSDRDREWLQLRQSRGSGALPAGAPDEIAAAFSELRRAASSCCVRSPARSARRRRVARDDRTSTTTARRGSVALAGRRSFRAYRYKAGGCGCHAHADLGRFRSRRRRCRAARRGARRPGAPVLGRRRRGPRRGRDDLFVGELTLSRLVVGCPRRSIACRRSSTGGRAAALRARAPARAARRHDGRGVLVERGSSTAAAVPADRRRQWRDARFLARPLFLNQLATGATAYSQRRGGPCPASGAS